MNRRDIFKLFGVGATLPVVQSIERLELKPEDAIVVKCDGVISSEAAANLGELFKANFPGRKVLVHGSDIEIKVLHSA